MATLPKCMKGILVEKTGGTEVLQYKTDLPLPTPAKSEILVRNEAIGINYIDTYFRTGLYPAPKPEILGKEGAGHVVALGPDVTDFKLEDRVVYLSGNGGYAEYTVAPVAKTVKVPDAINLPDACAALLQGTTAITLVEEGYKVNKGDWVLVLAASGGVGTWLCQILKAKGAHTIATVGHESKVKAAQDAGAETVVVESKAGPEEPDIVLRTVREKTAGQGVQAVFDGVGKNTFNRSLECVARKGSVISFGNASGAVEPFTISKLSAKNVKLLRPTLFNYIYTKTEFEQYTSELMTYILEQGFKVCIWETYPLQDVARAHNDLESRKTMGKLLLKP